MKERARKFHLSQFLIYKKNVIYFIFMIEDTDTGTKDKRGYWKPNELISFSPLLTFPIRFFKI